ncbi:MAG: hypothetical protein JNL11_06085 [Bdellovibrionaceae bacterium]|nr:hypothetical protein [Pseudobdellovibrionaceae bacterium]
MRMIKDEALLKKMETGKVYRRADLSTYSSNLDRYLDKLVKENKLQKVSAGLYLRPNTSAFGNLPANDKSLVQSFLKDDRFLINSFNNYNQLGLGLTQLYNVQIVYNYKRHGEFELGGKKFVFKRIPKFPSQVTKEFLLVDMLNNLKNLAEDENLVVASFLTSKDKFDAKKVLDVAKQYGRPKTKKLLEKAYSK